MSEAIIIRSGNVTKGYVDASLALKADKIEGKELSTNDYDNAAKEAVESLGTASKCDIGTSEGNVPVINSEGKLDTSILPSINITDSFTESSSTTFVSTKALVDGLATKAEVKKFTATVGTSWTQGAGGEYTQEVTVPGILETDTPTIDLILSDNVETAKAQIEGWANVSRITTESEKIKIYCYDAAPTIEIPVQIICMR